MPIVSRGKDWVFGQMLKDVAAFLDVAYNPKPDLSPQELIDKLDMVMSAAQRYVAQIPEAKLDDDMRDRKRPIRNLCYHIFRLEEALMEVEALRTRPEYVDAHNNLGTALADLGRLDDAIACYRAALRIRPDYADAHHNLGNALKEQGRLDEATAAYRGP